MFETNSGTIKPIVYVGIVRDQKLLLVDYKEAPNPAKKGWWIPAPGLDFGEDPQEKTKQILADFGLSSEQVKLHGVESFVLPGGWHLIYHFICRVDQDPRPHDNIKEYKWVSKQELESMTNIAHGKWDIGVGKAYLH